MLLNSYVGVSCSASWIKAVEIEHRRGVVKQVKAHAVPLPLGCIDERFGNIEDSQSVRLALQGISLLTPNFIRTCQIRHGVSQDLGGA
jgi:Tfp pilus assembly PilM family ATPase